MSINLKPTAKVSLDTKLERVLDYLKANGSITKDDMRNKCFYSNGGDAIFRLRNRGYQIDRVWEYTSTGAKYARYIYNGDNNLKYKFYNHLDNENPALKEKLVNREIENKFGGAL